MNFKESIKEVEKLLAQKDVESALNVVHNLRKSIKGKSDNDLSNIAYTYFWEQICYKLLKDSEKAKTAGEKALEIYRKQGDDLGVSRIYRDMGLTQEYLGEYDDAIIHLDLSTKALESSPELHYLGINLSKKGQVLMKSGNLSEAMKYSLLGYEILRNSNHTNFTLTSLTIVANCYVELKDKENSRKYIKLAQEYLEKAKREDGFLNEKRKEEIEEIRDRIKRL